MILNTDTQYRETIGLSLWPTLETINTEEGKRVCAAFLIKMKIQLKPQESSTGQDLTLSMDLYRAFDSLLEAMIQANGFDDDPSGGLHLGALGIPATYAKNFQDLRAFLGRQEGELSRTIEVQNVYLDEGLMVYRRTSPYGSDELRMPSSLTVRYSETPFQKAMEGNYRDIVAQYGFNDGFLKSWSTLSARLNTEKGTFSIILPESEKSISRDLGFANGSVTMCFTILDQRHPPQGASHG